MPDITHGTTVVAVRYADGVVMAGDRRATAATSSATGRWRRCSRPTATPASPSPAPPARPWRWSSCSSSSSSTTRRSRASSCRLEGKANQLRPDGAQPPARPPCRASSSCRCSPGYDIRRRHGPAVPVRRHRRPLRGERLRRHRVGQPPRRHGHQARLPRGPATASDAIDLAISALFQAADEDSATGGPDLVRGIYPTIATITGRRASSGSPTSEIAERFRALVDRLSHAPRAPTRRRATTPDHGEGVRADEHAVLRRARAGDEGPGRLRPQGHRPRPGLAALRLRRRHPDLRREPVEHAAQGAARSTTASPSPGSASTTSSTSCASPASATPTSRATASAARTSTPAAWPTSTPRSSARSSPTR